MTRRACKHGRNCGHEWCFLEDEGCILPECPEFEDSGWKPRDPRPREVVRALLDDRIAQFRSLKSSASGFRFGQGREAKEEATRRRNEITRLKAELRSWGEDVDEYKV